MKTDHYFKPDRRVLISWSEKDDDTCVKWRSYLFITIKTVSGPKSRYFATPFRTDDKKDLKITLMREWVDGLLGKGRSKGITGDTPVTDVICVCSPWYIDANVDERSAPGELAEFIEKIRKSNTDKVRIWLAPLVTPRWEHYRVRDVELSDDRHRHWLIRMRDESFPQPEDQVPWKRDIDALVTDVIDQIIETKK